MTHTPYILKEEEINILISGLLENGEEETYARMRNKTTTAMKEKDNLDDMLMDMHCTLLNKAREIEGDEDKDLKQILYQLASMMRILAHELYVKYIKMGKNRDNERFIRLASLNKDIPSAS